MQPQGLQALMPQGAAGPQPAPQMNSPRMTAAMGVVTSDAEEQMLDPRTLAMLKYKDALAAMQAADQMMAASQPAPTPPTVAERTKLAAEQGIMGLASKLSPGIQQQGGQMQAEQMQQAMSGGLPQLSAPNMAGMAGGGIVAFQAGEDVEDEIVTHDELGNPIYASDIARATFAEENAGRTDESEEDRARREAYATIQQRMEGRPDLGELAQTPPARSTRPSAKVPTAGYGMGDRTGQDEALMGILKGIGGLGKDAVTTMGEAVSKRVRGGVGGGMSDDEIAAILGTPRSGSGQVLFDISSYVKENPVDAISTALLVVPLGGWLAGLGVKGLTSLFTQFPKLEKVYSLAMANPKTSSMTLGALIKGGDLLFGGDEAPVVEDSAPTSPTDVAQSQLPGQIPEQIPTSASASTPAPEQPFGLPALAGQMIAQGNAPVDRIASDVSGEDELAALRESANVIRDRALDPDFVESSRIDVEGRAKEAYGIPEDLKELYRSRIEALDKPMYTPEEERSRKLSALLSGLASSNLIAQGGPAASRAIAKVSDDIREDSVARAEKQFDLASGLIGMDMQASQQAFGAGLEATITSMNQQGVALQMAISQLNAADNREAAALLQESQNGIEMTKQMIESFKNGQANARDVQRNVGARLRDLGTQINQLQGSGLPNQPLGSEITTAITVLENEQAMLQAVFKATLEESGFAVPEISEDGGEGDISDAELLRRLGN
jgi:hypothetical protein